MQCILSWARHDLLLTKGKMEQLRRALPALQWRAADLAAEEADAIPKFDRSLANTYLLTSIMGFEVFCFV